jgi:hypothetical protein
MAVPNGSGAHWARNFHQMMVGEPPCVHTSPFVKPSSHRHTWPYFIT